MNNGLFKSYDAILWRSPKTWCSVFSLSLTMDANIQHPLIVGGVDLVEEHLRPGISNAECIAGLHVHAGFRFGSAMNRRDRQLYDVSI